MKKNLSLFLICLLVMVSGIGIVNAETLTGTLESEEGFTSVNYWSNQSATNPNIGFTQGYIYNINLLNGMKSFIRFDEPTVPASFSAGAPSSAQTTFIMKVGAQTIGTGTIGYSRLYDGSDSEIGGFQFLIFDTWDVSGLSGDQVVSIEFNSTLLYGMQRSSTVRTGSVTGAPAGGYFLWNTYTLLPGLDAVAAGSFTQNTQNDFSNYYTATKPSGIGITGSVVKNATGTSYGSKAHILDGTTGAILTSDPEITTDEFNFNVPASSISISLLSSFGTWYNTTELFAPEVTPTPTVTQTPVPTVAPGYVRTYVETIDGTSGYTIHGSNIFLYDVEGSVWSNSSSDSNGEHYIDTLPYHTINAYATYTVFADHYSNAEALGLPTGYYGDFHYKLSMFPPAFDPGEGNVNLYVSTFDADTYDIVREASVQIRLPTGAVQGGNTGQSGTEIFVVPNNTVINIAASKTGYVGSNTVVSSGTGTTASAAVYLRRMTVTTVPTGTIPPGGLTIPPTVNPNDPSQHGGDTGPAAQEMMAYLASNGMQLVQLCFLVTILGLLGIKLGK